MEESFEARAVVVVPEGVVTRMAFGSRGSAEMSIL